MSDPAPVFLTHEPRSVDLAAIERELTALWKPPENANPEAASVVRACMSNLLVYCRSSAQMSVVPDEIDEVVRIHPSRVLLLEGEADGLPDEIEAYVSAHCHLSGDRSHVCSEQITIRAARGAVRRLPSTARSLLIGDLPTSLWWASHEAPPQGGKVFEELEAMADQVIYSSLAWTDPVGSMKVMAGWVLGRNGDRPIVADLAWRRLKPWRSLISQSLDPSVMPGALEEITKVAIDHGPQSLPQAWLLAGWLASRLGWQATGKVRKRDGETAWTLHSAKGPVELSVRGVGQGDPELRSLAIGTKINSQPAKLTFASTAPGRLAMNADGIETKPRSLAAPQQSRAQVVGVQLQDLMHDPVFGDAMGVARTLAESG